MGDAPNLSVSATATVRQRPSALMMVAEIRATQQTLELALQLLEKKREAVGAWMKRLGATDVTYGEPRLPDQVEPTAEQAVARMQRQVERRLGRGVASAPEHDPRKTVMLCFSAHWDIAGLSSRDVLILADRVRFETEEETPQEEHQEDPTPSRWMMDPGEALAALAGKLWEPAEGNEPHFLFLSCLSEDSYSEALREAFRRAQHEAELQAVACGMTLGRRTHFHVSLNDRNALRGMSDYHRHAKVPMLSEAQIDKETWQQVSESPRAAEFSVSLNATYELLPTDDPSE